VQEVMMTLVQLLIVMLALFLAFFFGQAFATPTRWWVWIPTYIVGSYLLLALFGKPLNIAGRGILRTCRRLLSREEE
jgi:hypothetical protein